MKRDVRPEWVHWQPVPLTLRPVDADDTSFPLPAASVDLSGAASRLGSQRAAAQLLEDGLQVGEGRAERMGLAFRELAASDTPTLITADSVFFLARLALDRAHADIEQRVLVGDLETFVNRSLTRMGAEQSGAPSDLVAAFGVARSVLMTARSLYDDKYVVPAELRAVVSAEVALIRRHAGPAVSPTLGFKIDYTRLAPAAAASTSPRLGHHLALAWLGAAAFPLAANGEVADSPLPLDRARDLFRAVLLLAEATEPATDREAAAAYDRLRHVLAVSLGPVDDVTLEMVADAWGTPDLAASSKREIASVVRTDKLRHALFQRKNTEQYDGVFALAVPGARVRGATNHVATSVRVLGAHASVDGAVFSELTFPRVGLREGGGEHARAWRSMRVLPSTYDLVAWMGSAEARAELMASGDDRFAGFVEAVDYARTLYPTQDAPRNHASLHDSWTTALCTWVRESRGAEAEPVLERQAYRIRKMHLARAAWVLGRHDSAVFARAPQAAADAFPPWPGRPSVFVEAHPEAYAELLGTLQQAQRAFSALGVSPATSTSSRVLVEAVGLLREILDAAVRSVDGEPATESTQLLPERMAKLEALFAAGAAASVSMVATAHGDLNSQRSLQAGTTAPGELAMVLHDRRSGTLQVAFGPYMPVRELVREAKNPLDDAGWRALLGGDTTTVASGGGFR